MHLCPGSLSHFVGTYAVGLNRGGGRLYSCSAALSHGAKITPGFSHGRTSGAVVTDVGGEGRE